MGFMSWLTGRDEKESDVYANYSKVDTVVDEINTIATTTVMNASDEVCEALQKINEVNGMEKYVGTIRVANFETAFDAISDTIKGLATQLQEKAEAIKTYEEATWYEKAGSTIAMLASKLGEGILTPLEEAGDFVAGVVGWLAPAGSELEKNCEEFIKKDWAHDTFNFYYDSKFADKSAITEDSIAANAPLVFGKTATLLGMSGFVGPVVPLVVSGLGSGTETGIKNGKDVNKALLEDGLLGAATQAGLGILGGGGVFAGAAINQYRNVKATQKMNEMAPSVEITDAVPGSDVFTPVTEPPTTSSPVPPTSSPVPPTTDDDDDDNPSGGGNGNGGGGNGGGGGGNGGNGGGGNGGGKSQSQLKAVMEVETKPLPTTTPNTEPKTENRIKDEIVPNTEKPTTFVPRTDIEPRTEQPTHLMPATEAGSQYIPPSTGGQDYPTGGQVYPTSSNSYTGGGEYSDSGFAPDETSDLTELDDTLVDGTTSISDILGGKSITKVKSNAPISGKSSSNSSSSKIIPIAAGLTAAAAAGIGAKAYIDSRDNNNMDEDEEDDEEFEEVDWSEDNTIDTQSYNQQENVDSSDEFELDEANDYFEEDNNSYSARSDEELVELQ